MKAYNVTWSYRQDDEYPQITPVIAHSEHDAIRILGEAFGSLHVFEIQLVSEGK